MGIHVKTDTGLVSMQAHVKTATGLVPMSLHVKTATGIVALSGGASAPIDADGPVFTSGATATPIAENSGAGQVVYTAAATDASLPITYSIKPVGDYAAFSINGSTGATCCDAATETDIKLALALLPHIYSQRMSLVRSDVRLRRAWVVEHKTPLGSAPDAHNRPWRSV